MCKEILVRLVQREAQWLGPKGHQLGARQRESSLNWLPMVKTEILRALESSKLREGAQYFRVFLQRARKSQTAWRSRVDSNPRDSFGFDGRSSARVWRA